MLPPAVKVEFVELAALESTAYVYYHEIMTSVGKPVRWESLSQSEKEDFVAYDPKEFLQARGSDVLELFQEFDLPVLFGNHSASVDADAIRAASRSTLHVLRVLSEKWPQALGQCLPELRSILGGVKQENVAAGASKQEQKLEPETVPSRPQVKRLSASLCQDIEAGLTRPYVQQSLAFEKKSHWGSLLHYMVQAARDGLGTLWPSDLIISSSSTMDLVDLLALQCTASYMAVVISTDDHWSLVVVHLGEASAIHYDGLACTKSWHLAQAVTVQVGERLKKPVTLVRAELPVQQDSWSCGHRLVTTFQLFVRAIVATKWPPLVPADAFTDDALRSLCASPPKPEEDQDKDDGLLVPAPGPAALSAAPAAREAPQAH